jgi:hypothetical protein
MDRSTADAIEDIIPEIGLLIMEDRVAEAAVLLFQIHKEMTASWFPFKMNLLRSAENHRELFLMATLISVAEKNYLSESFNLVPGLYSIAPREFNEHS